MSVAIDHAGPWTVSDVLALPDDGTHTRHELIDGTLIVSPAPGYPHQRAARRLAALLEQAAHAAAAPAEIFEAVNVETPAGLLIPDIAVVHADAARSATLVLPASAMIAVVEVVSPSTRRIDRLVKPGLYAEAGIPTFWLLDLEPSPAFSAFSLAAGAYVQDAAIGTGQRVASDTPFPVTVDLAALLAV